MCVYVDGCDCVIYAMNKCFICECMSLINCASFLYRIHEFGYISLPLSLSDFSPRHNQLAVSLPLHKSPLKENANVLDLNVIPNTV